MALSPADSYTQPTMQACTPLEAGAFPCLPFSYKIHCLANTTYSSHLQTCSSHLTAPSVQSSTPGIKQRAMMHSKKLAQLAKKCQRMVLARGAGGHRQQSDIDECCSTASWSSSSSIADKGHCVVYSADGVRFEVPLAYLGTAVFAELLRMSREEFGFASGGDGGRITLPCDSSVVEYVMCLVRREASEEVENALLSSIVGSCHYHDASNVAPSSMVALCM